MAALLVVCALAAPIAVSGLINCRHLSPSISTPALNETCRLLVDNLEQYDVNFGPHNFDNHLSYFLIALFRMGASADRIREAYDSEVQDLSPAIPSQHMIDEDSWQRYLRQGKYYTDYAEFIRAEVHALGVSEMLERYGPAALEGATGSLLHPLIHLGYGFELGDEEVISEGVGWLLSHGGAFPKLNPSPKYTLADSVEILSAMRSDPRLPTQDISLGDLEATYADVLSEYDVQLPEGDTQVAIPRSLEKAAIQLFGTACDNFFLLHLSTGSRALSQILPHIADAQVRAAALQQLWKGVVYVYALEGRPAIQPRKTGPLRPWADLIVAALPFNDAHFQKMVYLCHENFKLDGDAIWWSVAESVVSHFEQGGHWVYSSDVAPSDLRPPRPNTLFM